MSTTRVVQAAILIAILSGCSGAIERPGNGAGDNGSGGGAGGSSGGGAGGSPGGSTGGTGGGGTGTGGSGGGGGAGLGVPTAGNPFSGTAFYVNPDWKLEVELSASAHPEDAALLRKAEAYPTAIWLDTISRVPSLGRFLDDALAEQQRLGQLVVTVFVIYDLPNRDCAALASNGELSVDANGLDIYEHQYIDPIAAAFAAHPNQRIVLLIEPDSLGNIATNLSVPKCAASESTYRDAVAYALRTLAAPNTFLYLDAAHSGWLGWPDNLSKISTIYQQVLSSAGGAGVIRGFATDLANYSVLDTVTPELFDYQGNPCHDELTYVDHLRSALAGVGITGKAFLIDTSRNGRGGIRHEWGSWCNVQGAALGLRPVADPAPGIDAYLWMKPPGESDGTSDSTAPRFDAHCANQDATPGAPQAGQWFDAYFVNLVHNATPPL